jgi:hypothetical protein
VRDKKGRIVKYIKSETLDMPKGEYKIIQMILNYTPTSGVDRPNRKSDFEVILNYAEGEYTQEDLQSWCEVAFSQEDFHDRMVESCSIRIKMGVDAVKYSNDDSTTYRIFEKINSPGLFYPKQGWGKVD